MPKTKEPRSTDHLHASGIYELKYKICVSGSAETEHCLPGTVEKALLMGRLIAERGIVLTGGGALLKGIDKVVEKHFSGAMVEIGDPFARVESPAFLARTLKDLSPRFAVAIGAGLKGLEE